MSWILLGLLSAVFAAGVAIFGKLGVASVDSTVATTVRAIIMAVFLVLVTLVSGKVSEVTSIQGKVLFYIVLAGISGAISWIFYFLALKYGPASGVAALDRLSVVFVLILSLLFLSEKFQLSHVIGALLIVIGAILMVI